MNKSELLQVLSTKFYKVMTPSAQGDSIDNLQWYLVKVFDVNGDNLRDANIAFYVENEGQAEERAFWSPSEPKPDPATGFQQEINTYISEKITDNTIEAAFPETIDAINETAVYKVVMSDLSERRLFVDRDANGDLQHRQIV